MTDQGLPPSGQQFERKKQYRARGCRGGAYRKGRTQRSASYNMRRDQERRSNLDASAHQENDPHRLNRHNSYHNRSYRNHNHHYHRNQHYHGRRPHTRSFTKKESSERYHDAKSRTLSILPSGEDIHSESDEVSCPSDDVVCNTTSDKANTTSDKTKLSPTVSVPILPSSSSDSTVAAPLADRMVVAKSTVIGPIAKVVKESGVVSKQAAYNFSFFALSPSSFLSGKKAKNGSSYFD